MFAGRHQPHVRTLTAGECEMWREEGGKGERVKEKMRERKEAGRKDGRRVGSREGGREGGRKVELRELCPHLFLRQLFLSCWALEKEEKRVPTRWREVKRRASATVSGRESRFFSRNPSTAYVT